ncbi:hypothetical protein F5X68DRAFT_235082 [Plectosphaerella plurivora]|uniref:Uncharacterized protein n=1 Tax=Plectosphaerella plurivora TaxID=936078 RepID=A0A9P8V5E2_9PEZI|nr:hypothetical protein F5X68DRAFT_235082 [Plectosphaerella plurivora]
MPSSSPLSNGPVDIAAVIDDVVEEWKARNPDLSRGEIDKILASVEKAKISFLNPNTRRSADSDPEPTPSDAAPFMPLYWRKVADLAMGVNSTIAEARAIVRLA